MAGPRRYPPNRSLTWERLQRGWSHEEVAERVKRNMQECDESDTGLTGNTVRRWEIGERWPEPRFRKHLVVIFGKPASELGLLTPEEREACPAEELVVDLIKRLRALPEGAFGQVGRQTLLRGLFGAGIAPALGSGGTLDIEALADAAVSGKSGSNTDAVKAYREIATRQRELYWSTPARSLFESSISHTQLGVELLRGAASSPQVRPLAASLAESALLSARLAFFDLRQPAVAQRVYDIALGATRYADDHALAAVILGHMSFIPGFSGDGRTAMELLDSAQRHAGYSPGPSLRSWIHCVTAEVAAKAGDVKASVRHVRQAAESLNTSGEDPDWLDFYDASRLAGFTGYALLKAERYDDAIPTLEAAMASLASGSAKQRAVLLVDLATAHAYNKDAEKAASLANEALDSLEREWYGAAYDRLPEIRKALTGTPYVESLVDRARDLPALT